MRKGFRNTLFGVLALVGCTCAFTVAALGQEAATGEGATSTAKSGWQKITKPFTPGEKPLPPESLDKSLSLKDDRKPKTAVYFAVARLHEQAGNFPEAEKQYQAVLKENPKDVAAMNGYARLKERMGKPDEAMKLYQQAAKVDPRDAGTYNNLGLCYARKNLFDDAVSAMGRAILLQPTNVLYRNNMATILVDHGKNAEAFSHLRSVHTEAAAYYNMGFLLNRKGKKQEAAENFSAALRIDPTMAQAQSWLDKLHAAGPAAAGPAAMAAKPQPAATAKQPPNSLAAQRGVLPGWQGGNRAVANEPSWPARSAPLVRLPATNTVDSAQQPSAIAPPPTAPLPPETTWRPPVAPATQWR